MCCLLYLVVFEGYAVFAIYVNVLCTSTYCISNFQLNTGYHTVVYFRYHRFCVVCDLCCVLGCISVSS